MRPLRRQAHVEIPMAKSSPQTGVCALCKQSALLQWSHIIPNWVYRRCINMYPTVGGPKLIVVTGGVAQYRIVQSAEYMLCSSCEQHFRTWEAIAANGSFQKDSTTGVESFPFLETASTKLIASNTNGVDKVANLSADGADSLARFAVSVVWRAHASRDHFPKVQLGSYAEPLRELLLDPADPPLRDSIQVTLHLIEPQGAPRDRIVLAPWTGRAQLGFRLHSFVFFGLWFQVYVGKDLPTFMHGTCLLRKGLVWIGDAARLQDGIAKLKLSARSVGQLAKDEATGKV